MERLLLFRVESFVFQFVIQKIEIKIQETVNLLVFYGRETLSLTLRKERNMRVSENRVLRRMSGPKRVKVTGKWR
jgi:hypothetical protein